MLSFFPAIFIYAEPLQWFRIYIFRLLYFDLPAVVDHNLIAYYTALAVNFNLAGS